MDMQKNQKIKRPRDPIQLAKLIGDIAIGAVDDNVEDKRDPIAVGYGSKGGKERAERLTSEERKEIASNAAKTRWKKD